MSNDPRAPWNDLKWYCMFYFEHKESKCVFKSELKRISFMTKGDVCEFEATHLACDYIRDQFCFDGFIPEIIITNIFNNECRKSD